MSNWTEEKNLEVVNRTSNFTALAAKLGLSRTAIKRRAVVLGCYSPSWTQEQIEVVKVEWAKGTTAREIGEMINKSRNAVIGKAHRLKLEDRAPRNQFTAGTKKKRVRKPKGDGETDQVAIKAKRSGGYRAPVFYPPAFPLIAKPPISIMELKINTCRAIVGHGPDLLATYCGDDVFPGKPYCAGHCAMYYKPDNYRRQA